MARNEEEYLGDGLYARYNGQEIWLRAPREGGDHEVCLDAGMLQQLQRMVDNYEPPEPRGECFRGNEAAAWEREQSEAARRLK